MAEDTTAPESAHSLEDSPQKIVVWTDDQGRKHHAAEGTFAHKAHLAEVALAEEKAAAAEAASTVDVTADVPAPDLAAQAGDGDPVKASEPPTQLTSTATGKPAGPPRSGSSKPA